MEVKLGLTGLTGNKILAFNAGGYVMFCIRRKLSGKLLQLIDCEGLTFTSFIEKAIPFSTKEEAKAMGKYLNLAYDWNDHDMFEIITILDCSNN